eukprot:03085_3
MQLLGRHLVYQPAKLRQFLLPLKSKGRIKLLSFCSPFFRQYLDSECLRMHFYEPRLMQHNQRCQLIWEFAFPEYQVYVGSTSCHGLIRSGRRQRPKCSTSLSIRSAERRV